MNENRVSDNSSLPIDENRGFVDELTVVQQQLQEALQHLYSPFNDLAYSQLKRVQPLRRAAVVLATGVHASESELLRQQRIHLATALEMLNIALVIHQFLLSTSASQGDNPNQRSITGSVILTGDYCFTQSAIFAAKTDNVQVVEIFSQALKTISEGILRRLFVEREKVTPIPDDDFDTELALCEAGIVGAIRLVAAGVVADDGEYRAGDGTMDTGWEQNLQEYLSSVIREWAPDWQPDQQHDFALIRQRLSLHQQRRWQALQTWLVQSGRNN